MAEYGQFTTESRDAVDRFRKDRAIDYAGNPRGLVDERFVEELRKAWRERQGKPQGE
jgi:hypothetical protein